MVANAPTPGTGPREVAPVDGESSSSRRQTPASTPRPWKRVGSVTTFVGLALLGIGVLFIAITEHAAYSGRESAFELDSEVTFVLAGLGIIVLGLGSLLAAMHRE